MTAVSRRCFLKKVSGAAVGSLTHGAVGTSIALVTSESTTLAGAGPSNWALGLLVARLGNAGLRVRRIERLEESTQSEFCIIAGNGGSMLVDEILRQWSIVLPRQAESLCIAHDHFAGRDVLLAAGADSAGLAYALTELAERVSAGDPWSTLRSFDRPLVERPASRTRSVMRSFCSEVEDKSWFYDRGYWREYLTMLATCRFNRLSFTTGMAYNYAAGITDGYLVFPYPFLVNVPGYAVRAAGLTDAERNDNLEMLRFIGKEAARRGLRFQLGLWTLAYRWPDSPHATYRIEGLDEDNFPGYCRDALAQLLREVPEITGVTFRVHEESGIEPGRHDFWQTQFEAIARCGRRVEIDLHAKNMPPRTLDLALATGQPTVVSPKYCGEHMGLGYHPASIRAVEMQGAEQLVDAGAGLLAGDRTFTRYGYADYLAENRRWDVVYRIWPGTQRFLLNGDPVLFSSYSRNAAFCGAAGIEWTEPLFFKGRLGSGRAGGRCGYADASLAPARDFDKYRYTYLLWGRLGYDPDCDPQVWQRGLRREFGRAAAGIEAALSAASRVLPLITLAHAEAADCQVYWPEIYTNVPLAELGADQPEEIRNGGVFGEVSAFDPQLFQTPTDCARELLAAGASPRYTPLEVAQWLADLASQIDAGLTEARSHPQPAGGPVGFRRVEEDVLIQRGLAVFLAAKLRSAVLWAIYINTGSAQAASEAIARYREGRDAWEKMARRAAHVYRPDLTYGGGRLGGHWLDRITSFDQDIESMRARSKGASRIEIAVVGAAIRAALSAPARPIVSARHLPAQHFQGGAELTVTLELAQPAPARVRLRYRHVNQGEGWQSEPLSASGAVLRATIPGSYTGKRFALQYYFEIEDGTGRVGLFPGLGAQLAEAPYYVVQRGG